jgi:hypothetical protein
MRVFLRQDTNNVYMSANFAVAAEGFNIMGWELIGYQQVTTNLPQYARLLSARWAELTGTNDACNFSSLQYWQSHRDNRCRNP